MLKNLNIKENWIKMIQRELTAYRYTLFLCSTKLQVNLANLTTSPKNTYLTFDTMHITCAM